MAGKPRSKHIKLTSHPGSQKPVPITELSKPKGRGLE